MIPLGIMGAASPRADDSGPVLWKPAYLDSPPQFILDDESELSEVSGAVSQWGDVSGGTYYVGQSSDTLKPTLVPTGLNGRRYIEFDGSNDRLARNVSAVADFWRNKTHGWMFGLHRKRTADGSAIDRQLFLSLDGGSATRFGVRIGSSVAANQLRFLTKRLDADSTVGFGSGVATGTDWYGWLIVMDWATGACSIYIDGEVVASNGSLTSAGATSNTAQSNPNFQIGTNSTNTQPADADVAALLADTNPLDSDEIDQIFGCYYHRFGLTSRLDALHPYKTDPPMATGGPPPATPPSVDWLWVQAVKP